MAYTVQVENAERMMTRASATDEGIAVSFADGCEGLLPFIDLPDIGNISNLAALELPNPYELILRSRDGYSLELPWDFGRSYCDPGYRSRVEALATAGRESLGQRLRSLREADGLTQEAVAGVAGIDRVTLSRIETGEQSPRYETLLAIARVLQVSSAELFMPATTSSGDSSLPKSAADHES